MILSIPPHFLSKPLPFPLPSGQTMSGRWFYLPVTPHVCLPSEIAKFRGLRCFSSTSDEISNICRTFTRVLILLFLWCQSAHLTYPLTEVLTRQLPLISAWVAFCNIQYSTVPKIIWICAYKCLEQLHTICICISGFWDNDMCRSCSNRDRLCFYRYVEIQYTFGTVYIEQG